MKFTFFTFALALLALATSAQDRQEVAPSSSTTVLINGQSIQGKVLEIDGKHYVAVEDLAQSLRGTISYEDGQIAVALTKLPPVTTQPASPSPPAVNAHLPASQPASTSKAPGPSQAPPVAAQPPSSPPPSVAAPSSETGRIKGTLTYFFDFHSGNKADAGSKVWLVNGQVEIPADQIFVATTTAVGTPANPEQYSAIKYSIADEKGNFELPDIPPGQYTLVLQSAHTQGTLKEKRNLFGRGDGRNPRDSNGRVEFLKIQVKPGETLDASKDFGPNIN